MGTRIIRHFSIRVSINHTQESYSDIRYSEANYDNGGKMGSLFTRTDITIDVVAGPPAPGIIYVITLLVWD